MNRMVRITLVLLLIFVPFSVYGAEQRGSIQLTMRYDSDAVSGGRVTLYEITDWKNSDDPQLLAEYVKKMEIAGISQTVGNHGDVMFTGLEPGYYLLVQHEAPDGYLPMKPFCVSIPMTAGGDLIYDIVAAPKLERIPEPTLPQTGQLIWPIWVLLGGGISLMGIGILLQKKK